MRAFTFSVFQIRIVHHFPLSNRLLSGFFEFIISFIFVSYGIFIYVANYTPKFMLTSSRFTFVCDNRQLLTRLLPNRCFLVLTFILPLFFIPDVFAQDELDVIVDSKVLKGEGGLKEAVVTLFEGSNEVDQIITPDNGKFSFVLVLDKDYLIVVAKEGHVSKKISISTKNIPQERLQEEFTPVIEFYVGLFRVIKGLDVSILEKPIAKFIYSAKEDDFIYDEEHTKSIQAETRRLEKELAIKLTKLYSAAITNADKAFEAKEYQAAEGYFLEALDIRPDDKYAGDKINEVYKILTELAKNESQAKDKKYNTIIILADRAFLAEDYKDARDLYYSASLTKPLEAYPKNKMKEIDRKLEATAKLAQEAKEKKYNAIISRADSMFITESYTSAKQLYQKAVIIMPHKKYPNDMIKEVDQAIANATGKARSESIGKKYKVAIAKADNKYKAKDYKIASQFYQLALKIKPTKKYPQEKIDEINGILAAIREKEEDIDIVEEDKYQAVILQADEALNARKYAYAKTLYRDALALQPDNEYPIEKIKEIDLIIADINADEKRNNKETDSKVRAQAWHDAKKAADQKNIEAKVKAQHAIMDKKEVKKLLEEEEEKKLYLYELAQKYPDGFTSDTIVEEKRRVIKIVIVKNNQVNEYIKTIYDWGGIYYEKNGEDIKKRVYDTETKKGK